MEHCPLCGRDTACTTVTHRVTPTIFGAVVSILVRYNCIECWIIWAPNKSREWRSDETGKFNRHDLALKGLVTA